MRLGLRGRMVLTAGGATAAALLAVLILAEPRLQRRALDQAQEALVAEARLMARAVEAPLARGAGPEEIDRAVDEAAREVRARVTILDLTGRVFGDSAASGPSLLALDNHLGRPEVRQALAEGVGTSVRHSATVDQDLLYAAVPVRHEGRTVGVARLALALEAVGDQVRSLRRAGLLALLLAVAITSLLSAVLSAPLASSLEAMMKTAHRFAGGDLQARIRSPRRDELGELARLLDGSADQLHERLAEIARDRGRSEAILAAMEEGLLAVDHGGLVILANPTLRRHLELQEPVGRHHREAIRLREVGDLVEAVLHTGERRAVEVELRHPRRVFALTGVPFPGAQGVPHGALVSFHDATERRRLDQVRRDFVANASHELRTPLTSIRGFVEALEDGAVSDPPTAQRFLGKIRTHADRMAALVDDLLELSRLESGERPPHFEEVRPGEVAEDVVASLAGPARQKGIDLQLRDEQAPAILTDSDRLRGILENLVDNAVKYTPAGGHVEVRSGPAPARDGALLEVADDGPGIAPEHLPRIFERFYRVDKARSRELGGTGLGLAIVRHLAEGMGARVSVESQPGRGARFFIHLPDRPAA